MGFFVVMIWKLGDKVKRCGVVILEFSWGDIIECLVLDF